MRREKGGEEEVKVDDKTDFFYVQHLEVRKAPEEREEGEWGNGGGVRVLGENACTFF